MFIVTEECEEFTHFVPLIFGGAYSIVSFFNVEGYESSFVCTSTSQKETSLDC